MESEYLFQPRRVHPQERDLGDFRLLHELGRGGMAALYLATDELGRLVALKRMHPHLGQERDAVAMFKDEAAIAARLSHPNLASVQRLDEVDGELLIVMEYVHGETLAALFAACSARRFPLPVEAALHLLGQACLGLQAAHDLLDDEGRPLSVVHRDVTPQNLLVTYAGELKVVDFGVAYAARKLHETTMGTVKGKLAYLSPEQARGEQVDRRSDIFNLGLVLYEGLCGRRCYEQSDTAALMRAVRDVTYAPARSLRPDLPEGVEAIIERALAPRPADRYASATAMYRDVYQQLSMSPSGMTTATLGRLMQQLFSRRYSMREELRSLAFSAPAILEEEELTAVERPVIPAHRCEYCGEAFEGSEALGQHLTACGQHQWWKHNFGEAAAGVGPANEPASRQLAERQELALARQELEQPERRSLWQRVKARFSKAQQNPLAVRLKSIEARLQSVRDSRTSELATRGVGLLWQLLAEVERDGEGEAAGLLERLKPRLLRCGDILLAQALETEASAAYAAALGLRDLQAELQQLEGRVGQMGDEEARDELSRMISRKRTLLTESHGAAERQRLLTLRLEAMVDTLTLTLGKVLKITSSGAYGQMRAETQITVFFDSLVLELNRLGDALRELDQELAR